MTAGESVPDLRVPGYLGRVLDGSVPVGTCFQVAPGVLVTAWHVLDDIGAASEGSGVGVDPLAGGDAFDAAVLHLDPLRDLAVLTCEARPLGVAGSLTATDQVPLRTMVTVTGHAVPEDPGHTYRFLEAPGEWAGGTTRDDAVPLGRMTSSAVVPGMSGAPVIRDCDGAVAGVVSGRYNSTDGWLAGTVWVARTEDLAALLVGIAEVTMARPPLAGPVDLLLTVAAGRVRLTGPGVDVAADHGGVRPGLAEAVNETRRTRARAGLPVRSETQTQPPVGDLPTERAAGLLAESFLPGPVAGGLEKVLAAAERAHQPVRLGLAVPTELAGLPWEALPGPDGRPLVLDPLVSVYRKSDAAVGRALPGPLRIVVAIAAPDSGGGAVLDYERELRNVLAAVRSARQDAADVRVVPFATIAAIREELDRGPAHVLHITGHGSPGILALEHEDGSARPVTAEEFVDQAVPPGRMPLVVTLSACYTDAAAAEGGASFAARLCQRGAAAVIATEASITDTYATRLLARTYGALAQASNPDVIAVLSEARREVQAELEASPDRRDTDLAALGEWAAVTVLTAAGTVPLLDTGQAARAIPQPSRRRIAGLAGREDWYFVGRRAEQRRWPADLTGPDLAGIVVCGIGGTGKTTLAAEITTRVLARDGSRLLVSLAGPLTLESLLGAVISGIRRELLVRGDDDDAAIRALDVAARTDLSWQDRLAVLCDHVLDHVPVLVVLDNFEDNLDPAGQAGYAVRDEVLAGLLAGWVAESAASRLLITSRYPFTLPGGAERALSFRQLGALSRAETMKLAWSLPALDRLDEGQLDQVWRLVGGHPRSLEYLDALLSGGTARYPDVTTRLHDAVTRRLGPAGRDRWLASATGLEAALAETVALAADDVLLDDLLARLAQVPGAADLLLGVSVYREPVDLNAVLFQAGQPDDTAESVPDRAGVYQRITEILAAAGISPENTLDLASVPGEVRTQLAPHLAELNRRPVPPFRPPPNLPGQVAACQAASLLSVGDAGGQPRFFVHRWTATELTARAARESEPRLADAHRQAARYWLWRVEVWPQDRAIDIHDQLEARYHLLQAGDTDDADDVANDICLQLHTRGAWDQEASLIQDSLSRLAGDSPRRTWWIFQLGRLAQDRGDYDEAARQYQRALDIDERLGDQAGMATIYHQLGNVAYLRADYEQANNHYEHSLNIRERLGDQDGMADSYGQLGHLAQGRGDYDEAARQYQRALDIYERLGDQAKMAAAYHQLGNLAYLRADYEQADDHYERSLNIREGLGDQAGMADSYHQLGALAQARGDYDEAARQYQRALDISERLGNQAKMAIGYHNLGVLAQDRGDYDEATRQYQRALHIEERLGDQAGLAGSYHQLGNVAYLREDYDEAARQYRRALDISERLGDQATMAVAYHNLGMLAQDRGDYDEAARQYRRALDIRERLGDQVGMADGYSQLGNLEQDRGGRITAAAAWHVKALVIRLRLGVPKAMNNLRRLAAYRRELGAEPFASLLTQAVGDADLVEAITSLLDQVGTTGDTTA